MDVDHTLIYIGGGKIFSQEMNKVRESIGKRIDILECNNICTVICDPRGEKEAVWRTVTDKFVTEFSLKSQSIVNIFSSNFDLEHLESADIIFFTGGAPDKFFAKVEELNIYNSIVDLINRRKRLLIGTSAGALIMNKECIVTKDDYYPENVILQGLNLTDKLICEVHYEDEREDIIRDLNLDEIYCIDEESALIVENNKLEFINRVTLIKR